MGYTRRITPVAEHPFDGSWGYRLPVTMLNEPVWESDEFRHFVDRCHQEGIGVILDWVPGHFPKDSWIG